MNYPTVFSSMFISEPDKNTPISAIGIHDSQLAFDIHVIVNNPPIGRIPVDFTITNEKNDTLLEFNQALPTNLKLPRPDGSFFQPASSEPFSVHSSYYVIFGESEVADSNIINICVKISGDDNVRTASIAILR